MTRKRRWRFLEESEVDIVITDMKMPRISGREVLERVKKNWPHIRCSS